jgi:hypothetical protein
MKTHEDRNMYFSAGEIHWKPGAKSKDKTKTLLMPYGEMRDYQLRLDAIDPEWAYRVTVVPVADRIVCSAEITVNGVLRSATGDALLLEKRNNEMVASELAGTNAEAQAFKRACSAHNIGRELYFTRPVWVPSTDAMEYVWGNKRAELTFEPPYSFLNAKGETKMAAEKATAPKEKAAVEPIWTVAQRKALIDASLAKNDFAAKGMLGLSNLPAESTNDEIVAWGKVYRENRYDEEGKNKMTANEAAAIANEKAGL